MRSQQESMGTLLKVLLLLAVVCVLATGAAAQTSAVSEPGTSSINDAHAARIAQLDPDYAATIPLQTFMIYQLMFAIITPALITGAFAERMKFSAMSVFMILWSLLVYAPMAHMVWGKGGFLNAGLGGRFPTLDFAGGTIGALLTGIFASSAVNPIFKDAQGNTLASGLLDGNAHQLWNQFVGVAIAWALAGVGTLVILKIVDMAIGLRVPEDHEIQGLDLSQHGEEG